MNDLLEDFENLELYADRASDIGNMDRVLQGVVNLKNLSSICSPEQSRHIYTSNDDALHYLWQTANCEFRVDDDILKYDGELEYRIKEEAMAALANLVFERRNAHDFLAVPGFLDSITAAIENKETRQISTEATRFLANVTSEASNVERFRSLLCNLAPLLVDSAGEQNEEKQRYEAWRTIFHLSRNPEARRFFDIDRLEYVLSTEINQVVAELADTTLNNFE